MNRIAMGARLMIVSDLDHTMVDHHDAENMSLLRFNALWESNYRHDSLLVFSTGRSPTLYKQLRKEKPMLTPDITIMSVGTEITYGNSMVPDNGWVEVLNQKWDRNIVTDETSNGGMDLDILPQGAGKGQALAYLLKKFKAEGKPPSNTLVCGDSGNDAELFSIPEVYGVMVGNPNIIHAKERCAAGIIEAIGHFNLGPNASPRDVADFMECKLENVNPGHEVDPTAVFVFPSGVERTLYECIHRLRGCHGDQKGKQFRVWVDSVLSTPTGTSTWQVKFDKWELSGDKRYSCVTTIILNAKGSSASDGYTWVNVQQKWLEGSEKKDDSTWFF
ncbi:Sucrose phosphatase-like domain - like 2 [Theobroma cacao]|nr:Sucrose phosphatase-like domain - like 2 [Theobroma cacao]